MLAKIRRHKHRASWSPSEAAYTSSDAMSTRSELNGASEPATTPSGPSGTVIEFTEPASGPFITGGELSETNCGISQASSTPSPLHPLPQPEFDRRFPEPSVNRHELPAEDSIYQGQIVKVLVGSNKTPFYLHKPVLCQQIPYFAALLNRSWNDKDEAEPIDLSFISVDGFRAVAHWAYSRRLPDGLAKYTKQSIADPAMLLSSVIVYKAADQLMISGLQNALVDGILDSFLEYNLFFDFGDLAIVYENDLHHTPLYQLVLKGATQNFGHHHSASCKCRPKLDDLTDYPDVLKEIIVLFASFQNNIQRDVKYGDRSEYYMDEIDHGRPMRPNSVGLN